MDGGLVLVGEDAGRLAHILSACLSPWDVPGIHAGVDRDALAVDDQSRAAVCLHLALELPMNRVIPAMVQDIICAVCHHQLQLPARSSHAAPFEA